MNKYLKRLLALILICALSICMIIPVCAVETEDEQTEQEENSRASIIFPSTFEEGGVTFTKSFEMTATNVKGQVHTHKPGKCIKPSELPSNTHEIYVRGTVTHSAGDGTSIQIAVGIGLYNASGNNVIVDDALTTNPVSGVEFARHLCATSILKSDKTYYGFILNLVGMDSTVNGDASFYYG